MIVKALKSIKKTGRVKFIKMWKKILSSREDIVFLTLNSDDRKQLEGRGFESRLVRLKISSDLLVMFQIFDADFQQRKKLDWKSYENL